jgi:predicted thioesterase
VNVEVGLRGDASLVVAEADTAVALRSGSVAVLGTPRLVALFEEATVVALFGRIDAGHTTVGMRIQIDHLQPTAVGGKIFAEAVLERIEGRRLTFTVSASDERGLVAAGKVTRVVVDVAKFLTKAE